MPSRRRGPRGGLGLEYPTGRRRRPQGRSTVPVTRRSPKRRVGPGWIPITTGAHTWAKADVASSASITTDFGCSSTLVPNGLGGPSPPRIRTRSPQTCRAGLVAWPWCGAPLPTLRRPITSLEILLESYCRYLVKRGAWRTTPLTATPQWRDCFCLNVRMRRSPLCRIVASSTSWCSLDAPCRSLNQPGSAPQVDGIGARSSSLPTAVHRTTPRTYKSISPSRSTRRYYSSTSSRPEGPDLEPDELLNQDGRQTPQTPRTLPSRDQKELIARHTLTSPPSPKNSLMSSSTSSTRSTLATQ